MKCTTTTTLILGLTLTVCAQPSPQQIINSSSALSGLSVGNLKAAEAALAAATVYGTNPPVAFEAADAAPWSGLSEGDSSRAELAILSSFYNWGATSPAAGSLARLGAPWGGFSGVDLLRAKVSLLNQFCTQSNSAASLAAIAAPYSLSGLSPGSMLCQLINWNGTNAGARSSTAAGAAYGSLSESQVQCAQAAILNAIVNYRPSLQVNSPTNLTETWQGRTVTLPDLRVAISNAPPGTVLGLGVDAFVSDGGYTVPAQLPMTNISVSGNGRCLYVSTTNHNDAIILYGRSAWNNITVSNVWPNEWSMYPINPGFAFGLEMNNTKIYSSGTCLYADAGNQPEVSAANDLFLSTVTNNIGICVGGSMGGTWSNCTLIADGVANQAAAFESPSTNALLACSISATNASTSIQDSQNAVVMGDDPSSMCLSNCTINFCKGSGAYVPTDFSDCAFQVANYGNGPQTLIVANSSVNLAADGPMGMLGQLIDKQGGQTTIGTIYFINLTYSPSTNGVIFNNNGLPVIVKGGNLVSGNFSEPAKVTFQ